MKIRFITAIMTAMFGIFYVTACTANQNDRNDNQNTADMMETDTKDADGKKLVIFFSHTGENYNVGYINKGNTHIIADMIADAQ